uniref:DUF4708 domain-containing protein n=1 Tax=Timema bartmani TaxID=61472 RepID=A0A7R9F5W1_9NEOP|nr:unnamed protein product [Timema bartmani]
MAPIWNQAGEYMVQGRNFLHNQSPMNAIKMEIGMKNDEMFIAVWPLRVRMRPLEFSDLDIVPSTKEEFFSKREGCISELSLGAKQLHVLPSLKKGRIVSISRKIPSSCPYQSYKELKRHWKNLYGYRLPESDETILYFSMHFNAFSSTVYTYPSLCVRPDGLQFHSRVNFKEVLGSFIQDLTKKVPRICGHEFAVTKKLVCAVPKMLSWDQDASLKTPSKVNMVKLSTIVKEFQLKREIEPVTKLDEDPFPKKSRSRPRVQPDMDVEALARANDLGKVNTATLVKWLRENKVSCKVKDKKSDLVNKVMAYLNISSNL